MVRKIQNIRPFLKHCFQYLIVILYDRLSVTFFSLNKHLYQSFNFTCTKFNKHVSTNETLQHQTVWNFDISFDILTQEIVFEKVDRAVVRLKYLKKTS